MLPSEGTRPEEAQHAEQTQDLIGQIFSSYFVVFTAN